MTNASESKILFNNATILTGRLNEVLSQYSLLVKGEMIEFIGPSQKLEDERKVDARVFDLEGLHLMPGLIDCHLHFWGARTLDYLHRAMVPDKLNLIRAVKDAESLLESGFTTVRDAGGNKSIYLRQASEEGTIKAPRIISSHKVICITGGHYDLHFLPLEIERKLDTNFRLADGPSDCRRAVREQVREGADFIKICTTGGIMSRGGDPKLYQFSPEELNSIVDEAHAHGKMVSAHAYGKVGIKNALDAGVDTIEHGTYLDESIGKQMVDRGAWLIPTLSILRKIASEGASLGMSNWAVEKAKELNSFSFSAFKLAHELGVSIASGTDFSGCPPMTHGDNALEPILMVEAGMNPSEALASSTSKAAQAIGLGGITGALEKGMQADLLVLNGNPLQDISVLADKKRIKMVIKQGRVLIDNM